MLIRELPLEQQKLMRKIIRIYCQRSGLYGKAHEENIGIEQCEEEVERAIDDGLLQINYNHQTGAVTIEAGG